MKTIALNMLKISIAALLFAVITWGCNSSKTSDDATTQDSTVAQQAPPAEQLLEYPLPTPFEITQMLNQSGAGYIYDLSNEIANVDKYETEKAKALNLGIYGADLSYANTYNQTQETWLFVDCAKKLTGELQIPDVFDQATVDNIKANLANKDTLYQIITKTFYLTFDRLNKNERGSISVMVLAGGWVEGMYLSTQLAKTAQNKDQIVKELATQKAVYERLLTLLDQYKDNADVADVVAELTKLKVVFDKVTTDKLTDAQLDRFAKQIEAIRKKMVS